MIKMYGLNWKNIGLVKKKNNMEKIIISIVFVLVGLFISIAGDNKFTIAAGTIMFWSGVVALIVLFIL